MLIDFFFFLMHANRILAVAGFGFFVIIFFVILNRNLVEMIIELTLG